jgi:hypothetical protein
MNVEKRIVLMRKRKKNFVYRNDEFWDEVLSNYDYDAFELDGENHINSGNAEVRVNEWVGLEPKVAIDEEVGVELEVGVGDEVGLDP